MIFVACVGSILLLALAHLIVRRRRRQPITDEAAAPLPLSKRAHVGSFDGDGTGDHDQPFIFGALPSVVRPHPFNTVQYARLLLLRSRWQDGLVTGDGAQTSVFAPTPKLRR